MSETLQNQILHLIRTASRVMGLRLCLHDRSGRSGLPQEWLMHTLPHCTEKKSLSMAVCAGFDGSEVHLAVAGKPEGRIHQCPHGFTEIAVPVFSGGMPAGVLFAGQCWMKKELPPHPQLILPPSVQWLEERKIMVRAVATELGRLLEGDVSFVPDDRRRTILSFLNNSMERMVSLGEVAKAIGLSDSRASHLVREIFNTTFPELVTSVKLKEASSLLSSTDHPIGKVAQMVGYDDQNYFSRIFAKRFNMPPRDYRKRYPADI